LFQHFIILASRRSKLDSTEELLHAEEKAKAEIMALLMADEEDLGSEGQSAIGGGNDKK
jgi:hypothetical protein